MKMPQPNEQKKWKWPKPAEVGMDTLIKSMKDLTKTVEEYAKVLNNKETYTAIDPGFPEKAIHYTVDKSGVFHVIDDIAPSPFSQKTVNGNKVIVDLLKYCPAMAKVVRCPGKDKYSLGPFGNCRCSYETELVNLLPHLDDEHRWSREKLFSWLRTLPFDLSFTIGDSNE